MSMTLPQDARARVDAHLDAVEKVLIAAGKTREQRRGVVDDLEAQILEMLAAKSQTPGLADIEAVLAQLDPPSAYASGEHPAPPVVTPQPSVMPVMPVRPRYSRTVIWGLVCILVSLLLIMTSLATGSFSGSIGKLLIQQSSYSDFMSALNRGDFQAVEVDDYGLMIGTLKGDARRRISTHIPVDGQTHIPIDSQNFWALNAAAFNGGATLDFRSRNSAILVATCSFAGAGMVMGLLGTVLGWIAFGQIRASKGTRVGLGMALFDGLCFPVLLVLGLLCIA